MTDPRTSAAPTSLLLAAFAAVYVIWGSTYLAIRVAVETLPPFLMASARFFLAGGVLLGYLRWRGAAWPSRAQWRLGAGVGTVLLLGGTGLVGWAEQQVPSGLAALIVATTPLWFVTLEWLPPWRKVPARSTVLGLALGFMGVGILVSGEPAAGPGATGQLPWLSVAALLAACFCWAGGSLWQRHRGGSGSPWLNAAVQMLCGGVALLIAATLTGEWARWDPAQISLRSVAGWFYLVVFGSWVAFGAYVWLLKHSTPARVSTYAYVNPVIAVLLGWWILGEPLTVSVLWAGAVILGGVVLVQWPRTVGAKTCG